MHHGVKTIMFPDDWLTQFFLECDIAFTDLVGTLLVQRPKVAIGPLVRA